MGYEIPKNLKYEEKILFNLSMWQAAWLGAFGTLAAIIFFKTPFAFEIKAMLGILLLLIGAGFAFFNFKEYADMVIGFLSKPREIGYLDKGMQKFIEVKAIRDNTITLNNGAMKSILQVQPINFHILSTRQQQAIISAYKDFLNSLDFPIQIVMRTVNLSLDEYLQHLELKVKKSKSEKLQSQFNDFAEFVKTYIEQNAVKNRLFYIVIPAGEKDFKKALSQLEIRSKLCQDKLKNCNLSTKRLSTNELVSMLASYFEGFVENGNEYQTLVTLLDKKQKGIIA
ncbi:MAG TPA: PrgI family protein [archaeon]|nr:PrgI family protein [archaeon]